MTHYRVIAWKDGQPYWTKSFESLTEANLFIIEEESKREEGVTLEIRLESKAK